MGVQVSVTWLMKNKILYRGSTDLELQVKRSRCRESVTTRAFFIRIRGATLVIRLSCGAFLMGMWSPRYLRSLLVTVASVPDSPSI